MTKQPCVFCRHCHNSPEFLATCIEKLNLSAKTKGALRRAHVYTVEDFLDTGPAGIRMDNGRIDREAINETLDRLKELPNGDCTSGTAEGAEAG